jgi:large subunit ribosomal protein L23
MRTVYDVILGPVISEQSMEQNDIGKYAFKVARDANKIEIKKAVEAIFGVKVLKVTTLNMQGKIKRTGRYPEGPRAAWKKAVVRLTPDSKSIEFFEGMV